MRAILVYPICWSLFWIGHAASRVLSRVDDDTAVPSRKFDAVYRIYNSAMVGSYRLQRWAEGPGVYSHILPWHPPQNAVPPENP